MRSVLDLLRTTSPRGRLLHVGSLAASSLSAATIGVWGVVDGIGPRVSPWILVALGSVSAWNTIGLWANYSRGQPDERGELAPSASRNPPAASADPIPFALPAAPHRAIPPSTSSLWDAPPADAAGRLWNHLIPPSAGELPAHLVGPVREVAFDPDVDLEPGVTPELDPMEGAPGPIPGPDPSPPGAWAGSGTSAMPLTWTLETPWEASNWLELEALIATPPHLRSPSPPAGATPPGRRAAGVEENPSRCATCDAGMPRSEPWHRCAHCRRPLCPDCIVETLTLAGRGWCAHCTALAEYADAHLAG